MKEGDRDKEIDGKRHRRGGGGGGGGEVHKDRTFMLGYMVNKNTKT